jgi:Rhodopirellula transposase DDE domain
VVVCATREQAEQVRELVAAVLLRSLGARTQEDPGRAHGAACPIEAGTPQVREELVAGVGGPADAHAYQGAPVGPPPAIITTCSVQAIINSIAATRTSTGLKVFARLDDRNYPKKVQVSDEELATVNLTRGPQTPPRKPRDEYVQVWPSR